MRVKVFAVGAALLAAALLAACGGSDNGDSSEASATQVPTASDEPLSDDESDFLRRVEVAFRQSEANFDKVL